MRRISFHVKLVKVSLFVSFKENYIFSCVKTSKKNSLEIFFFMSETESELPRLTHRPWVSCDWASSHSHTLTLIRLMVRIMNFPFLFFPPLIYLLSCRLPYLRLYSASYWLTQMINLTNHQSSCLNLNIPMNGKEYQPIRGRIGWVRLQTVRKYCELNNDRLSTEEEAPPHFDMNYVIFLDW